MIHSLGAAGATAGHRRLTAAALPRIGPSKTTDQNRDRQMPKIQLNRILTVAVVALIAGIALTGCTTSADGSTRPPERTVSAPAS